MQYLAVTVQGGCMELHVPSVHSNSNEITAISKQKNGGIEPQLLVNHFHEFR